MTKEELENRTVEFAARCIKVCHALPRNMGGSENIAGQLFRSATSVAANYSESGEAESDRDFVHKLKLVMKELAESRTWLRIIGAAEYIEKEKLSCIIEESLALSRIFSSSIITMRARMAAKDPEKAL